MKPIWKQATGSIMVVAIIFVAVQLMRLSDRHISKINERRDFSVEGVRPVTAQDRVLLGLKININTATAEMLQALPKVGPSLAKSIIDYRKAHGRFKSIEDLDNVPGVGEKTMERLRTSISVE